MFRVNKLTDYGIVLMAHVARCQEHSVHSPSGLPEETHLPLPTVSKLLRQLSDHGLLVSHPAVKAGNPLPREPTQNPISDILLPHQRPIGFTHAGPAPAHCHLHPSSALNV